MKRLYHDATYPLFSSAYIGLVSVVQGVALGALLYIISTVFPDQLNVYVVIKVIIVFLMVCLFWHRYAIHVPHQTWPVTALDTIIPMSLGVIEISFSLSILGSTFYFCLFLTAFWFGGFVAYCNLYFQHRKREISTLYTEKYSGDESGFGEILWREILSYTKRVIIEALVLGVAFSLISAFIGCTEYSEELYTIVVGISLVPVLIYLFHFDIGHKLRNSKEVVEYLERTGYRL